MRNLIEKGRAVQFTCNTLSDSIGVIADFQAQTTFVVQMVSIKTGKTTERKVVSIKSLVPMSYVIDFDESEEIRGKKFEESVEAAIAPALEEARNSPAYKEGLRLAKLREMTDFERFLEEERVRVTEELLRSKGC